MKANVFVDRSAGNCPLYEHPVELDFPALPNPGETVQLVDEELPRYVMERKWRATHEGMDIQLYLGRPIRTRSVALRNA